MDEKKAEKIEPEKKPAKAEKIEPTEIAMIKAGVTRIYSASEVDARKAEGWEVK